MPPRILLTPSSTLTTTFLAPNPLSLGLIRHPQQRRLISAYGYEQSKALTFTTHGSPPSSILKLHTHSLPPAHGRLLTLRLLAAPINPADINQLQGIYPSPPTFTTSLGTATPLAVGGNEGVAEITAVGAQAALEGWRPGQWAVFARPGFGTWRTCAQCPPDLVLRIPDEWRFASAGERRDVSAVQAGTVSVNPCTAYAMLTEFAALRPGEWFVQNAANGGVGRAAVQLGRIWGLRSINVVRARETRGETERLVAELRALGADVVVTEEELLGRGFGERVAEWTNGGREVVRLGLNAVGGKSAVAVAKALSAGGTMVTYGAMGRQPVQLSFPLLVFKNVAFRGFWVSKWSEENPEKKRRAVEEVLKWTREGKFADIPVDECRWTWETDEATLVEAVEGTLDGFRKGKGVFVFEET